MPPFFFTFKLRLRALTVACVLVSLSNLSVYVASMSSLLE